MHGLTKASVEAHGKHLKLGAWQSRRLFERRPIQVN